MEVALARSHRHLHADEPAGRDAEGGQAGAKEARVEDDAGVRGPVVLPEEVDDRVAPDLLLAVAGDADEVAHPLAGAANVVLVRRVGADARDADELRELFAPGLDHAAESRRAAKIDSGARALDRWLDEESARYELFPLLVDAVPPR